MTEMYKRLDILVNPQWLRIILKVCENLVKSHQIHILMHDHHDVLKCFYHHSSGQYTAFYGHRT